MDEDSHLTEALEELTADKQLTQDAVEMINERQLQRAATPDDIVADILDSGARRRLSEPEKTDQVDPATGKPIYRIQVQGTDLSTIDAQVAERAKAMNAPPEVTAQVSTVMRAVTQAWDDLVRQVPAAKLFLKDMDVYAPSMVTMLMQGVPPADVVRSVLGWAIEEATITHQAQKDAQKRADARVAAQIVRTLGRRPRPRIRDW